MKDYYRPQVLFLGNGFLISYSQSKNARNDLMKKITTNKNISDKTNGMPFPLEIILRTENRVYEKIKENKNDFYGELKKSGINKFQELLKLNFDDIITTNYSYELEEAALNLEKIKDNQLNKICTHTSKISRVEPKYLIRTYNEVTYKNHKNRIWHIHGEAKKPNSIIFDHYSYGNLLFKYKSFFEIRRNKYEYSQNDEYKVISDSWLDSFILGDIYVMGFSFDFSEVDMWWLLERKKRERAKIGTIYFYEPKSEETYYKKELLKVFGVEIIDFNYSIKDNDYREFYNMVIKDIEQKISKNVISGVK